MSQELVKAEAKYIRISPFKLRRIANTIRGKEAKSALRLLKSLPHKGAGLIYSVIHSAVANATNNNKLDENKLIVKQLLINEGPKFKRFRARARGRSASIEKRTSHIVVAVGEV